MRSSQTLVGASYSTKSDAPDLPLSGPSQGTQRLERIAILKRSSGFALAMRVDMTVLQNKFGLRCRLLVETPPIEGW
jgi:hypothetical protein